MYVLSAVISVSLTARALNGWRIKSTNSILSTIKSKMELLELNLN